MKGKVALVTGASRGIGRAIAEAMSREGAQVVVNARRREGLEGLGSLAVEGDVGEEADARRIVASAVENFGRLDILVNNAGIGPKGPLEEMKAAEFDRVVRTNLRGPYLTMREAIPVMRGQGGGTIVNVASLAGRNPVPHRAAYAATKWGLIGLTRSVMGEVRKDSIRLILVEPGSTNTEFGHPPEKTGAAERMVQPEDVAAVVVQAIKLPGRATLSEFEIRPTNPSW